MQEKEISQAVIRRMPRYYRYLGELLEDGVEHISSNDLSKRMNVTASQIRQDLNNFGGFGQQGYGYNVKFLYEEIGKILGLNQKHNIIVIGAGNLGQALANYVKFEKLGFVITALFDVNPALEGVTVRGIKIHMLDELEDYCNCDALTGLFNRMKFEKDVSLLNEEHPDTIECVYIDVVGLHEINNHLGHQTGDSMLCMVAGTARSFFPNDRLYRIGGDEFVILCCNRKHDEVLLAVEKLRMTLRGAEYEISVGVQQGTGQENVQNIVNRAEDAMRRDKEAYYQQNGQERRMRSLNEKLDRLMQEKQDADQFIRVIAPEYIAVYLINFAQDSFRKILIPDFFRDMLDKCNGSFRRAILEYIRLYIAPEDQEEFESLTCAQIVRERLVKEGTIDEHYKRSDGMPIHLRIMACDGLNKEESIWIFAKDTEKT